MPYDFSNPDQRQMFRQKMSEKGIDQSKIDKYMLSKLKTQSQFDEYSGSGEDMDTALKRRSQMAEMGLDTSEIDKQYGFNRASGSSAGVDPLDWAAENQAYGYLTAKTGGERESQAKAMQKMGVEGYLKQARLPDLLSDKELENREKSTSLVNQLSQMEDIVSRDSNENVQGVGPLGRFRPGFMTDKEGTELKRLVTEFTANKMKEISGAAVSDREVERLSKSLPTVGDTEENIVRKARSIRNALEIGQEMQEYAKRNRMTLDEAYKEAGAESFSRRGEEVPSWIGGESSSQSESTSGKKSGGYVIEQVD